MMNILVRQHYRRSDTTFSFDTFYTGNRIRWIKIVSILQLLIYIFTACIAENIIVHLLYYIILYYIMLHICT
jgi:hypothetical protein